MPYLIEVMILNLVLSLEKTPNKCTLTPVKCPVLTAVPSFV